jgi:hypothetical protein
MKSILIVTICLFLGFVFNCQAYQANDTAKTITSDGSYLDTSLAVGYVVAKSQNGWFLSVGAAGGTYVWTNMLVIGMTNAFTIAGASTNNRPTIIFSAPTTAGIFIGAGSNLVTLRDFIFDVGTTGPTGYNIGIGGSGVCFRITDCKFLNSYGTAFGVQVGGINQIHLPGPYGLIDNCQFYFPGGVVYNYVNVFANGNIDNWCWTQPMSWGTTNSVVIENNSFSQPHSAPASGLAEAMGGARMTIRYNNITNIPESFHGYNSGARSSTLQVEMYQNNWTLNDPNNTLAYLYLHRGGTSVIWSNTVSEVSFWCLGSVCQFWVECASSDWQSEYCPAQLLYPANYPALQQVGQGVVNGAPGTVPVYAWGNNFPGTTWGNFALGMNTDSQFIQQGRDIFTNSVMPNYVPLVYPHPLVASGGTLPGNFGGSGGGNSSVVPPTNLQAHPPGQ